MVSNINYHLSIFIILTRSYVTARRLDDSCVDKTSFFGSFADFMLAKSNSLSMYLSCSVNLSIGNLLSLERFVARYSKAIFVTTRMN